MVQQEQLYLCKNFAITSGTSQGTSQYSLQELTRQRPGPFGLATFEGTRDPGMARLFIRCMVTASFDQTTTTLDVVPTIADTSDMTAGFNIEQYRARLVGAALQRGAVWHFPLRPISAAEVLDPGTGAPIWPIPLGFIGVKFIVTGTAFAAGSVTCCITDHVSPDAYASISSFLIPPKIPLAGF